MMGFCEYEKRTGTGLAVLIRSLLWRRRKNEKKRCSLTFSSVEKEAKRHSPHQGLPAGGGCKQIIAAHRRLFLCFSKPGHGLLFYRLAHGEFFDKCLQNSK